MTATTPLGTGPSSSDGGPLSFPPDVARTLKAAGFELVDSKTGEPLPWDGAYDNVIISEGAQLVLSVILGVTQHWSFPDIAPAMEGEPLFDT